MPGIAGLAGSLQARCRLVAGRLVAGRTTPLHRGVKELYRVVEDKGCATHRTLSARQAQVGGPVQATQDPSRRYAEDVSCEGQG